VIFGWPPLSIIFFSIRPNSSPSPPMSQDGHRERHLPDAMVHSYLPTDTVSVPAGGFLFFGFPTSSRFGVVFSYPPASPHAASIFTFRRRDPIAVWKGHRRFGPFSFKTPIPCLPFCLSNQFWPPSDRDLFPFYFLFSSPCTAICPSCRTLGRELFVDVSLFTPEIFPLACPHLHRFEHLYTSHQMEPVDIC